MTGGAFSEEVDLDLLADYVGGALDGTDEHVRVTRLVTHDAAWRTAHDDLVLAMATVTGDLRALGAAVDPMPADVAERLAAALAATTAATTAGTAPETAEPQPPRSAAPDSAADLPAADLPASDGSGDRLAVVRHLSAVPDAGGPRAIRREVRRRRRVWRSAAPIAAAAGVLAFAGFGLTNLLGGSSQEAGSSGGLPDAEVMNAPRDSAAGGSAGPAAAEQASGSPLVVAIGGDYRANTLGARAYSFSSKDRAAQAAEAAGGDPVVDAAAIDPALRRLAGRPALQECLNAIGLSRGGGAIDLEAIDYGRFDGEPALVVWFSATDGQWAWVSGPQCGAQAADPDTRYFVRVG